MCDRFLPFMFMSNFKAEKLREFSSSPVAAEKPTQIFPQISPAFCSPKYFFEMQPKKLKLSVDTRMCRFALH